MCARRQLPHAPENPIALLSLTERRAINLTWARAFDGNSPLIRYILEVSENSESFDQLLCLMIDAAARHLKGNFFFPVFRTLAEALTCCLHGAALVSGTSAVNATCMPLPAK